MSDLIAQVANFSATGQKASQHLIAPDKDWVRNHIPFILSGWNVDVFQLPSAFAKAKDLRGKWVHTTTVYVRDVPQDMQREAERIVIDLCHLLSFASMSEVRPFAFELAGHRRRWASEGRISDWRPPIEPRGDSLAALVHKVWPRYRKLKRSRKLPELIHYLTLTDAPDQPVEVRMLLAFVALENAKGTWARFKRLPQHRGQFIKATTARGRRIPYRLEELLVPMFAEVRMRPRLKGIVRVRNQIVHLGVTSRSFKANVDYYERTKALLHEYILRLLAYSGTFYDYRTQQTRTLKDAT